MAGGGDTIATVLAQAQLVLIRQPVQQACDQGMMHENAVRQTVQGLPESYLSRRVAGFMADLVVDRPVEHETALPLPCEPRQKILRAATQGFSAFPSHRGKQAIYPVDMQNVAKTRQRRHRKKLLLVRCTTHLTAGLAQRRVQQVLVGIACVVRIKDHVVAGRWSIQVICRGNPRYGAAQFLQRPNISIDRLHRRPEAPGIRVVRLL
ncbi:MAG: hypothetical protein CRU78_04625 [Candidatus Accumulibacter phosphatis]|uniref:Uncharacterized protein n=1 Tax=Candidatus Accumulibacter phosphatis TaxID=327160 RepID=A0A6A7RQL7_9PROT|nr:hypothetical protein [Candidatus Accumulibacter phosphatis]